MKNCLYQNKRQIYKTQNWVKYKYIRLYVLQYLMLLRTAITKPKTIPIRKTKDKNRKT